MANDYYNDSDNSFLRGIIELSFFLFSTDGVIGRVLFTILFMINATAMWWVVHMLIYDTVDMMPARFVLITFACIIALSMISLSIRRVRDIDEPLSNLAIPFYNIYLLFFIKGKSQTMKIYRDFLRKHKIEFKEEETGLYFNFQGIGWIIFKNESDPQFLQLATVIKVEEITPEIYKLVKWATADIKCVRAKCHTDPDHIKISAESFLDKHPILDDILFRMIDHLQFARSRTKHALISNDEPRTNNHTNHTDFDQFEDFGAPL